MEEKKHMKIGEIKIEALRLMLPNMGSNLQIEQLTAPGLTEAYRSYLRGMIGSINRCLSDIETRRVIPPKVFVLTANAGSVVETENFRHEMDDIQEYIEDFKEDVEAGVFKGDKGDQGPAGSPGQPGAPGQPGSPGQTGAAAGFGEVTASVTEDGGLPSVTVSMSGPNTAKNIGFTFRNLHGAVDTEYDPTSGQAQSGVAVAEAVAPKYEKPADGIPLEDLDEDVQGAIGQVADITALLPSEASEENKLADKNFVNSTVGTNTANYISKNVGGVRVPFDSLAELQAYTGTVAQNDYAFVTGTDADGNTYFDRYKASVSGSTVTWAKEYRLNNSSFTAVQWAAINSGISAALVASVQTHMAATNNPHSVTKSQVGLGNVNNTSDANKPVSTAQQTALNAKVSTSSVTHETWTFTLDDDTTVTKEVVLWNSQA